jgi:predicted HicB family RNase H-like nuclease
MSKQVEAFPDVERQKPRRKNTTLRLPAEMSEQIESYLKNAPVKGLNELVLIALNEHLQRRTRPVYVPEKLYRRIENLAKAERVTAHEWAAGAIEEYLLNLASRKRQG